MEKQTPPLECSFCRRPSHEVAHLIAGANESVCDQCVELLVDVINEVPGPHFPPPPEPRNEWGRNVQLLQSAAAGCAALAVELRKLDCAPTLVAQAESLGFALAAVAGER